MSIKSKEKVEHACKLLGNIYIKLRYYRLKSEPEAAENTVILFINDKYLMRHPGLVDRFKAIVGMYYISAINGCKFKLQFNTPFKLEKYLCPNKVDWALKEGEIDYGIHTSKLLIYDTLTEMPYFRGNANQYHCYFYTGYNYLQYRQIYNWEEKWRNLFYELFRPSEYLENLLKNALPKQPYVAVHLRFVNALGRFEKGFNKVLSANDQQKLTDLCLEKIEDLKKTEKRPLYIISDSGYFIGLAEQKGYMILGTENIHHISYRSESEDHDKVFVDFFTMSYAEKIYAIRGEVLYNSVFPRYAAIIGNVSYEVIKI